MKERIIEFLRQHHDGCTKMAIAAGLKCHRDDVDAPIASLIFDGKVKRIRSQSSTFLRYTLTDKAL